MSTFSCPKCGYGTGVTDTRAVGMPNHIGQPYIRRRRKCGRGTCKHRYTTIEIRASGGKKITKMGDSQYRGKALRLMDVLASEVKKELAQKLKDLVKQMVRDLEIDAPGGKS